MLKFIYGKIAYGSVVSYNVMHGEVRYGHIYTLYDSISCMIISMLKEELRNG
jgi:hypothetical protein